MGRMTFADKSRRRPPALAAIALATAGFIVLTLSVLSHADSLQRLDEAISGAAHGYATGHPAWVTAMRWITTTGSTAALGPADAVLCLVLLRSRHWRTAIFAATAMIFTLTVRLALATLIARPRPVHQLAAGAGWSFPSGHTTASATFALVLALVVRRTWVAVAAGVWVVLVGVSRVALVVHWPSDVLGAWLLVAAVVPAIALGTQRLLPRLDS